MAEVDCDTKSYDNVISDLQSFMIRILMKFLMGTLILMGTSYIVRLPHIWFNQSLNSLDDIIDNIVDSLHPSLAEDIYQVNNLDVHNFLEDYNLLCPFFAWAPADTIQKPLPVTIKYARGSIRHIKVMLLLCFIR
jgi:hypothetical protein